MSEVKVTVEYFAQARAAAGGVAREQFTVVAGTPTSEIVRRIAHAHGPKMIALLLDEGDAISCSVILAVDGAQVSAGDDVCVKGGETITIIPPISGGQAW